MNANKATPIKNDLIPNHKFYPSTRILKEEMLNLKNNKKKHQIEKIGNLNSLKNKGKFKKML